MNTNDNWKTLYRIGGIAALLAAILFRRNIGAEVSLFIGVDAIPRSIGEWFVLLQSNPFVGLSLLAVFDIFNYILEGVIFLALGAAFWHMNKSIVAVALASGLVGITINLASNISLTMLSLSEQYSVATSDVQKDALLSAGQAILATNDPLGIFPSTSAYVSLLLIAVAGLLFSVLMLSVNRVTGIVGLLASGFDLVYCLTFILTALFPVYLFLAVAGLFYLIWHLLVARLLLRRMKEST
jgi:hypothetical protein